MSGHEGAHDGRPNTTYMVQEAFLGSIDDLLTFFPFEQGILLEHIDVIQRVQHVYERGFHLRVLLAVFLICVVCRWEDALNMCTTDGQPGAANTCALPAVLE